MYQLFVFFMVTDPRTTVSTKRGRIVVVAIVALVEALMRLGGDFQIALLRPFFVSPPILALAIVGPIAMFWDLRRQRVTSPNRPTDQPSAVLVA
jgi:Na+-translocating ferredoxin:NAD+ oxidoreductase RnfD subunit